MSSWGSGGTSAPATDAVDTIPVDLESRGKSPEKNQDQLTCTDSVVDGNGSIDSDPTEEVIPADTSVEAEGDVDDLTCGKVVPVNDKVTINLLFW